MNRFFLLFLFLACLVFNISAQNPEKQFELKGVVKEKISGVISGLRLSFKNNNGIETHAFTDINGEFFVELSAGNYEVTTNKNVSEKFIAFVNISENGLNPSFIEFNLEADNSHSSYPKIIKPVTPKYPPAALATRAMGEVLVKVKIDNQGKVIEAKSVSGHPLLRKISELSAKQFLFDSLDQTEREINLTFVFISYYPEEKNIKRYSNPYRILTFGEKLIVDTVDVR